MNGWMRDDKGAVAVVVAMMAVVLIAASALVVDLGYWFNVRRQLQAAADAAALAGCRELANGGSDTVIWDMVTAYARRNDVRPVEGLTVVPPSPGGQSDIGDDFVKVTLSSTSASFFGRVLGKDNAVIMAQAKAQLGYLAGARTPVPWALPILHVDRMVARVNGAEHALSAGADSWWRGWLPVGASGFVDVIAYNDQTLDPNYPNGVPEEIFSVANLIHLPSGSRFTDVRLPRQTFTSGYGETVHVYIDLIAPLAQGESLEVAFGKKTYTCGLVSGSTYAASFAAPDTEDLYATTSMGIQILDKKGKTIEALPGNPRIVVRRSTFPVKDIEVEPIVFPFGSSQPAQVAVELNDYEYGKVYEMKVIGGAGENGNFMAIDFHTLRHTPYWRYPQDPAEYPDMPSGTNQYYDYIAGTASYDFIMHIGDTVWTEPGNMSGPQTRAALNERFDGEPSDFEGWVAAGMPPTKRLVYVPITEKVQDAGGITPLRIVSFGSFYIESVSTDGGGALVRGRFIEYPAPGWIVSPTPPDGAIVVRAPHLVADGVDF